MGYPCEAARFVAARSVSRFVTVRGGRSEDTTDD
jgi:hypothetical protein